MAHARLESLRMGRAAPPSSARSIAERLAPQTDEPLPLGPVRGRTYSLHGNAVTSARFYAEVDALADECLRRWPDARAVLRELRGACRSRSGLRRLARRGGDGGPAAFAVTAGMSRLAPFLLDVEGHRRALSLLSRLDPVLGATREQYLVFFLEHEITNRLHRRAFARCRNKLALLPHCLRDLSRACRSKHQGLDHECGGCSVRCTVHALSVMLRDRGVEPYLWLAADLDQALAALRDARGGVGVLGVACIPELVMGMRRCDRAGVPVVGVPLDANRCARWLGAFHPNTVSFERLEALLDAAP